MFKQHFFTLSNGNKIPAPSTIGTGSIYFKQNEDDYNPNLTQFLERSLKELKGVIHIDGADCYKTYPETGDALKKTLKKVGRREKKFGTLTNLIPKVEDLQALRLTLKRPWKS